MSRNVEIEISPVRMTKTEYGDQEYASIPGKPEHHSFHAEDCNRQGQYPVAFSLSRQFHSGGAVDGGRDVIAIVLQKQIRGVRGPQDRPRRRGSLLSEAPFVWLRRNSREGYGRARRGLQLSIAEPRSRIRNPFPPPSARGTAWPSKSPRGLTIDRPRPKPRMRWRAALSSWWYSSKIAANSELGMPIPVSRDLDAQLPLTATATDKENSPRAPYISGRLTADCATSARADAHRFEWTVRRATTRNARPAACAW